MTASPHQNSGGIILFSTYELGHQPLNLAWPLAVLDRAGLPAEAYDLSVQSFPEGAAARASFIAVSVPMHTALRLGVAVARRVRDLNPTAHINFYGLYAWLNKDHLLNGIADSILAGEAESSMVKLVKALDAGRPLDDIPGLCTPGQNSAPSLERLSLPVPQRARLPQLDHYAHYSSGGRNTPAGSVETTRGCKHTCAHCPITPVYRGRFFVVPVESVLADVRQQVEAGAGHITFGDPDFLNGPGHALKVTRRLHAEFPHLTFDFTAKVEHIVRHADLFPEFVASGLTFVTSAFESTSDFILERLDKGHTLKDMHAALDILRRAGVTAQPTWMPFTPWTAIDDYLHLLAWIREHGLVAQVSPIQLSIRMLVPPGSALLDHPDVDQWLGPLEATNFTYRWHHPDPLMDDLHNRVVSIVEGSSPPENLAVFDEVEALAHRSAGLEPPGVQTPPLEPSHSPRLTEDWFC